MLPAHHKTPQPGGLRTFILGVHPLEELSSQWLSNLLWPLWVNLSFTLLLWWVSKYSFSQHCCLDH